MAHTVIWDQVIAARELCELFGLDPARTHDMTLRFSPGGRVTLDVTMLPSAEGIERLVALVRKYRLVPREEGNSDGDTVERGATD